MPGYLPIEVQRNGTFACLLSFVDTDGSALDLTGATFVMGIRYAGGAGSLLGQGTATVADAAGGTVDVLVDGRQLNSLPGGMEIVQLAYDLVATQGGLPMPLLRGPLILLPGVS